MLTQSELKHVHRLKKLGRTYESIAKILHRRKASVMSDYKAYYNLPTKRREWQFFDAAPPKIPEGTMWSTGSYTHKQMLAIRRKNYPEWRWQYWMNGTFENDDGEKERAITYSNFHIAPFDRALMRKEAIENFRPQGDPRYTYKWRLIRVHAVGYNLLHLVKRSAPSQTAQS